MKGIVASNNVSAGRVQRGKLVCRAAAVGPQSERCHAGQGRHKQPSMAANMH
jgi:hypothetical protein